MKHQEKQSKKQSREINQTTKKTKSTAQLYTDNRPEMHQQAALYAAIQRHTIANGLNYANPVNRATPAQRKVNTNNKTVSPIQNKENNSSVSQKKENPNTNEPVSQMAMEPHIVSKNAHLRKVEGGKVVDGWFGKGKIGDRIPYNTEIEADETKQYESGKWISAKYNGLEGAIRSTKIVKRKNMTEGEIDALDDNKGKDPLATTDKVIGVVGKIVGSDEKAYSTLGYKKTKDKKGEDTNTYEDDTVNDISKGTEALTSGLGMASDITGILLAGRKMKKIWKEKRWDWSLAATGLKILKSTSSAAGNTIDAIDMTSRLVTGQSKDAKTEGNALSSLMGKITGSVGLLKDIVDIISTSIKVYKKKKGKDVAALFQNIGTFTKDLIKLLAKFKVVSKKSTFFKTSVPFLGAIISGIDALLSFLKIGDSKKVIDEMAPKSEKLKFSIIRGVLNTIGGVEKYTGDKNDTSKIFHEEKRGMMLYRKKYLRVNPYIMNGIDSLSKNARKTFKKRRDETISWFKLLEVENREDKSTKAEIAEILLNMKSFKEGEATLKKKQSEKPYQTNTIKTLIQFVLNYMRKKEGLVKSDMNEEASKISTDTVIASNLIDLATDSSKHRQLIKLKNDIKEYELADKLVEINEKRKSVSIDSMITSITSTIADLTGAISGFFSAGTGTVVGKVIGGAVSGYQGTRSFSKFVQGQSRKYGKFGADKSRSSKNKHKEYVNHAKFLTKMWISEADKASLHDSREDLDKSKDNVSPGLLKVKSYLEATGLKAQDVVEAPAMQIPDMIVEALKNR